MKNEMFVQIHNKRKSICTMSKGYICNGKKKHTISHRFSIDFLISSIHSLIQHNEQNK